MLQETQLYWYKILFLFELLAAEAIFSYKLRRRKYFVLRALGVAAVCIIFAAFYPLLDYTVVYNSGIFFTIFFVTLIGMKICFDESWWNILFSISHLLPTIC